MEKMPVPQDYKNLFLLLDQIFNRETGYIQAWKEANAEYQKTNLEQYEHQKKYWEKKIIARKIEINRIIRWR